MHGFRLMMAPCLCSPSNTAGIIEEGKSIMEEDFDDDTMDACLIAAGQRTEQRLTSGKEPLMLFVRAARPHFAREGPLQILRGAGGDQSPLNAHCQRASSSWPDRHVAYARTEARVRQKAVLGLGDGAARRREARTLG